MNDDLVEELFDELDKQAPAFDGVIIRPATKWIVVDLETTGFSHNQHTIVELGMVAFEGTKRVGEWGRLIRSHGAWSEQAEKVHKIKKHELYKQASESEDEYTDRVRSIKQAMQVFAKWSEAADVVVAYNADFDKRFLMHWSAKQGVCVSDDLVWLCPNKLAQQLGMGAALPNLKLETLAKFYGIPTGELHRAVQDSDVTASVLMEMLRSNKVSLEQVAFDTDALIGEQALGKDVHEALYGGQRKRRASKARPTWMK